MSYRVPKVCALRTCAPRRQNTQKQKLFSATGPTNASSEDQRSSPFANASDLCCRIRRLLTTNRRKTSWKISTQTTIITIPQHRQHSAHAHIKSLAPDDSTSRKLQRVCDERSFVSTPAKQIASVNYRPFGCTIRIRSHTFVLPASSGAATPKLGCERCNYPHTTNTAMSLRAEVGVIQARTAFRVP